MATVDTIGGTTLPRNNGATIVFGGNIDSSNTVTNAPSTTIFGRGKKQRGHNGPIPEAEAGVQGGRARFGVQGAKGRDASLAAAGWDGPHNGVFAFNMVGGAVIGKRMSTTINGEVNTILHSGGITSASTGSSIHSTGSTRRYDISAWTLPGGWQKDGAIFYGGSVGALVYFIDPATGGGTTSTDSASTPTRAIPGELILHHGGSTPLQVNYNAKTN